MSDDNRRAYQLIRAIAESVTQHRARYFREPSADGFRIYIGLEDAQLLEWESQRRGDFGPPPKLKHGDEGLVMGLPFTVDEAVPPGRMFFGYRLDTTKRIAPGQPVTVTDRDGHKWAARVDNVGPADSQNRYTATINFGDGDE